MEEVAEGIHRLGSSYINFYLVEESEKITIVDSGLPAYWEQIPQALSALGRSMADVDAVLLTHSHADHIGTAAKLANEDAIRILIHSADVDSAARAERVSSLRLVPFAWRLWFTNYSLHLLRSGATKAPPLQDPAIFGDGERLDVPGRPRVIHLPGHTAGSSALFFEQRGTLFSGDALVTLDTLRGKKGPAILTDPFSADEDRARESLGRLERIEAGVMLPGHGEPWRGGVAEAVRLARQKG